VVSADLPANGGQIVEVIGVHAGQPVSLLGPGHVWQVCVASGQSSLHYRYRNGVIVTYGEGPVPDCRLRPLTSIVDHDELPLRVDLPMRRRHQQTIAVGEPELQS